MTLEERARPTEDPQEPGEGYRPSVILGVQDELRLLDEALEEAKARPRPPRAVYAAPPVPVRPSLGRPVARPVRAVEDRHAAGQAGRASEGLQQENAASFEPARDLPDGSEGVRGGAEDEPTIRRQRVEMADVLAFSTETGGQEDDLKGSDSDVRIDRKRLLAAIICILQEELTKQK